MIKKFLFIVILLSVLWYLYSCNKVSVANSNCTNLPVDADSTALLSFAKTDSIIPTRDSTGLYYQIIDSGTGAYPLDTSQIFVSYTASFLNGIIFDSTTNYANTGFVLNNLVQAWQIGIPKIKAGGRIKLLVPSALAYGCGGSGTAVPPNTPVFFDVTLYYIK